MRKNNKSETMCVNDVCDRDKYKEDNPSGTIGLPAGYGEMCKKNSDTLETRI